MRIAVLTTDTSHHAYFIRELRRTYRDVVAFVETASPRPAPFEVSHPFEEERNRYEWDTWFDGNVTAISELASTHSVTTMNTPEAVEVLRRTTADAVIVFGTGVLKPPTIDAYRGRIFNLHGGDPEEYRGLDTHLWAIFHRDFPALVTTLHRLDAGVDTGDIVLQANVPLVRDMPLSRLRAANTEVCVKLATAAIDMIARDNKVPSRAQRRRGRYYSAMPASLKGVCDSRFAAYTRKLGNDHR